MAEFGNGLADESLLDSDSGHPELEDPGVGDEEPGLEEGEAAIEDPVSEGHCFSEETTNRFQRENHELRKMHFPPHKLPHIS